MSRCLCHNSTLSLLSTNQAVCATMCQNSTLCLLFNKSFVCVTMFMAQHHSMSDVQQIICMSQCLWHNSTLCLLSNKIKHLPISLCAITAFCVCRHRRFKTKLNQLSKHRLCKNNMYFYCTVSDPTRVSTPCPINTLTIDFTNDDHTE